MRITTRFILNAFVWVLFWSNTGFAAVSFQTGQSFTTPGSWFEVVATGDVNHDGRTDIVAATGTYFSPQYDYRLLVYLQSPTGTYPTTQTYYYSPVFPGIKTIAIGDVNNDSLKDVVIGYHDSIAIFFQNTTGTLNQWVSYYSGPGVDDLKVADMNNDSLNDIVVCHWNGNYLRVFYQTFVGFTSQTYPKPAAGYDEIEVGDINSDGLNDVVFMAGQGTGGIHVFTQNSSGTLNNYVSYYPVGGNFKFCNAIVIADLNGDGANDIAGTKDWNTPNASLNIWFQDTTTHLLKPPYSTPTFDNPENIEVADFDCDGSPDIVMNHSAYNITVWSKNDSGNYTNYKRYTISVAQHPKPQGLAVADINSDGKIDVLSVGNFTTIQLLYNNSAPNFFSTIDTLIKIDTVSIIDKGYNYYFTSVKIDTIQGHRIIQTDSFKVNITDLQYNVRTDSMYLRSGYLCQTAYQDVVRDTSFKNVNIQKRDTLFWSTKKDTLFILNNDLFQLTEWSLFPNPFDSYLMLHVEANEPTFISIYDFLGQSIWQQSFTQSATIQTEWLENGVYFYEIKNPKGKQKVGKIVKQ